MKIVSKETFCLSPSAEVVEGSSEIAHMIAQAKKPHNIRETLIKPCMIKAPSLVLGVASSIKLAKISLSNSTIKTGIDELANDIEFQVLQKIKELPFFAIQFEVRTDVTQLFQLLVYICYVGLTSVEEEMLFCRLIDTTAKAENVFKLVASYFDGKGICTNDKPPQRGGAVPFPALGRVEMACQFPKGLILGQFSLGQLFPFFIPAVQCAVTCGQHS